MAEIIYPSQERIIEYNLLALEFVKAKKADSAKVLSSSKLKEVIEKCQETTGDIYDKALILLKGLVQKHPFASGNRRTAFIAVKDFCANNHTRFSVGDLPENSKVLLGIREGYYSDEEIKEWIKNGKIRKFIR